ncbi:MAG: restriction endonuclease subunit S [Sodaliphilus sp.]|nr:restriction endonuclease subunit S [Sodaliphilus sp.]
MEWKTEQLGNLITIKYGKDHKKLKDGPFPVYGSGGIMRFVDTAIYNKPSLLLPRKGSLNNIMFTDKPFWTVDTMFWSIIDESKIEPKFLYYAMCKKNLVALNVGTSVPSLTVPVLEDVSIPYPPIPIQRKIAGILSALDSKIENNNKINANLEAQAQALFKSWFVDFTPFKDQPFVDSELGPIPQGWKVGKLGDICTFKRGKNLLSKNAIDEGVPVVAGGLSPSCYHNQANTSAPVVTVSGSGANAGFMRMYHVDVWASDCSFIDVSCDYLYFVYCFLSVNRRLLKHAQTGAVQPHVKPADIHDFDVVIPEEDIVKAFQSIIKELLTKVGVNEKENQRLAALRDTLLPKLMSGEIKL